MECVECGTAGAQRAKVAFNDRKAETIYLCEECVSEFRAADLIDDVSLVDEDTHHPVDR